MSATPRASPASPGCHLPLHRLGREATRLLTAGEQHITPCEVSLNRQRRTSELGIGVSVPGNEERWV